MGELLALLCLGLLAFAVSRLIGSGAAGNGCG